jgi:TrmH family RNA methyltransferase
VKQIRISAENAEYQIIRSLKLNRAKRNKSGETFIEGTACIEQAAAAGLEFTRIILPRGAELSGPARSLIASRRETLLVEMAPELYAPLGSLDSPPELLATTRIRPPKLEELPLSPRPFLLVFDRPGDFGNLGSAIRSANAFGVDAVLILGHGVDPWEPKVISASRGSVFRTPIASAGSRETLAAFIRAEKAKNGLRVLGTDSAGAAPLTERTLQRPLMLVIGNEAKGMSQALKALCDETLRIPLAGAVNSLNAACAASIFMWEVFRYSLL